LNIADLEKCSKGSCGDVQSVENLSLKRDSSIWGMGDSIPLGAKPGIFFWASLALITAIYKSETGETSKNGLPGLSGRRIARKVEGETRETS